MKHKFVFIVLALLVGSVFLNVNVYAQYHPEIELPVDLVALLTETLQFSEDDAEVGVNQVYIYQDGNDNVAHHWQSGVGNWAGSYQVGNHNSISSHQEGTNNWVGVYQSGDNNTTTTNQEGMGNLAGAYQVGDANTARIHQNGNNYSALVLQNGNNNSAVITQGN